MVCQRYLWASVLKRREKDDLENKKGIFVRFDAFMQQPAAPKKHEKASGAGGSIIEIAVESDR